MATKVDARGVATPPGSRSLLAAAPSVRPRRWPAGPVGTCFPPRARRTASRLLWLAHASTPRGRLVLDAGAVRAVVDRRLSLLPAGVIAVAGSFAAGDPVDLVGRDGRAVARGLVNYDAASCPACSAARPGSWPSSSGRTTSARSSTATTWCSGHSAR